METAIFASKRIDSVGARARRTVGASLLLGLVPTAAVHALGLGELTVRSALGQPLDAEVGLLLAPHERLEDVTARLAGYPIYTQAHLARPEMLSGLTFKAEKGAGGRPIIRIRSRDLMREPAFDLLLDVQWHDGSMVRHYGVLLDPPALVTPPPLPGEPAAAPAPSAEPAAPAPAAAPAPRQALYGPVKRGEILSEIARRLKPRGVSTPQMTAALFKANPHAFIGGNMNRLRWGTSLYLPSDEAARAMSRNEAAHLIRAQYEQWQGRGAAAAPAEAAPETPAAAVPEAQQKPATSGKAPAEGGGSGFKILAPTEAGGTGDVGEMKQRLEQIKQNNAEVQAENEEMRAKLVELEAKTRQLAAQVVAAPTQTPAEPAVTQSASAQGSGTAVPQELVGDAPVRLAVTAPPAPPAAWWADPLYWVVILAALLLAAVLGLTAVLWRRSSRGSDYKDFLQALKDEGGKKRRVERERFFR